MDRKELIDKLKLFKKRIEKKYKIEKMILFGSRTSKVYKEDGDVDIILVGDFKGKSNLERAPPLYIEWELDLPVDFLCYSLEEYKKLAKQITIVREALRNGIIIK
ncbi:nucleotidyltransferase domain-containing protein [Candidatus Pacearchaeota archaeon]|nr:nucleotidyltransferase domain-containing protein [Candidatus Pacearchaeota archaeon]